MGDREDPLSSPEERGGVGRALTVDRDGLALCYKQFIILWAEALLPEVRKALGSWRTGSLGDSGRN